MKKSSKKILIIFLIVCIILIPLLINILFKFDFNIWWLESEWSAGEALAFYGGLLSFIGTVLLGTTSIWQTEKSNKISKKILDKDLLESADFIQLENKIEVNYRQNKDSKITWSAHHQMDYGANILIEPYEGEAKKFNEYLIRFYFSNSSIKNHIKSIELEYFMCVQDPEEGGIIWGDNSNSPIPLKLDIELENKIFLNWISSDKFYVQFKIYCEPQKIFDSMMKNKVNLCYIFKVNIINYSNVKTEMLYKMWISKDIKNEYKVINTNSTVENSEIIDK